MDVFQACAMQTLIQQHAPKLCLVQAELAALRSTQHLHHEHQEQQHRQTREQCGLRPESSSGVNGYPEFTLEDFRVRGNGGRLVCAGRGLVELAVWLVGNMHAGAFGCIGSVFTRDPAADAAAHALTHTLPLPRTPPLWRSACLTA